MVDLVGIEPTWISSLQGRRPPHAVPRPKYRISFPVIPTGGIYGIAASLNLYHFIRIGSLHSVLLGNAPRSPYYKYGAFLLSYKIYRILPYLNGNHTFTTPMVAMAVTTGLEPATSSVTDWRALQLLHATIFCSDWSLICVHLGFERLRVYSLIRSQLPGARDGIWTRMGWARRPLKTVCLPFHHSRIK